MRSPPRTFRLRIVAGGNPMLGLTSIKYLVSQGGERAELLDLSPRQGHRQPLSERGKIPPVPSIGRFWPVAVVAGTAINLLLFTVLSSLGEGNPAPVTLTPAKLTIGFARKEAPVAPLVMPSQKQPEEKARPSRQPRPAKAVEKVSPKIPLQPKTPVRQPDVRAQVAEPVPPERPKAVSATGKTHQQRQQSVQRSEPQRDQLADPVPFYKLTAAPRFIHKQQPVYPGSLREQGREATVKLEVYVDAGGKVRDIKLLQSAGSGFDQAAIAAIRASTFAPGNINGKPVPVLMRMPIRFKLR